MRVLENCEPKRVFYYFEEICKIPHGSRNTKQISDYLVNFAKDHGFDYVQDELNNVVIYKPATAGYENAPTVILQGHMDMVCEKRPDVEHDFEKDGLNLSVKDGYVSANGTTLGGDDGIAVAYALALLDSTDIPHPALEVLVTVDEEIGLLGAVGLGLQRSQRKTYDQHGFRSRRKSLDQLCRRSFRSQQHSGEESRGRRKEDRSQDLRTDGWTFRSRDRQETRKCQRSYGTFPLRTQEQGRL